DWVLAWARGSQPPAKPILKKRIAKSKSRDVFVYFDNDAKVRAPFDAQELIKRVASHYPSQLAT
ncbi:MAG: hypothetical protein WBQ89_21845, partial [Candidatus Acidiferrum sp.]